MKLKPADAVWCGVLAATIAHNTWASAHNREQLSAAMDRYRAVTPAAEIAIWLVAGHLSRRLPVKADPVHGMFVGIGALQKLGLMRYLVLAFGASQVALSHALGRAPETVAHMD